MSLVSALRRKGHHVRLDGLRVVVELRPGADIAKATAWVRSHEQTLRRELVSEAQAVAGVRQAFKGAVVRDVRDENGDVARGLVELRQTLASARCGQHQASAAIRTKRNNILSIPATVRGSSLPEAASGLTLLKAIAMDGQRKRSRSEQLFAAEKRQSRARDEYAIRSGSRSRQSVQAENAFVPPSIARAPIDFGRVRKSR